jgi:hypothetical protein
MEDQMSVLSREVRAVQNAALGSVLIWRTASQYQTTHETGNFLPLPLAFLVLPILFHEETAELVSSTRSASGLRKLTEKFRSAEESKTDLLLSVGPRATQMRRLSWESVMLGVAANLITLNSSQATVMSLTETPLTAGVPLSIRPLLKNADKLGEWFAKLSLYEISLQVHVEF